MNATGRINQDTVTGVLHFVAQVGENVYHAVLDTIHAVVGTVQWVFDKVKTGLKKLISFVEMLFHWDDIRLSKDVIHKAFKHTSCIENRLGAAYHIVAYPTCRSEQARAALSCSA